MKRNVIILFFLLFLAGCGGSSQNSGVALPVASNGEADQPNAAQSTAGGNVYPYPAPKAGNGYPSPSGTGNESPETPVNTEVPQFSGKLAFHSNRLGGLGLYIMDGASGDIVQVPTSGAQAYEPDWSPDCRTLVYTEELTGAGDLDIYITSVTGNNAKPLLVTQRIDTKEWAPAWSPNGTRIAYQTNPDKLLNICFADPNGNDLGCLTRENYSNAHLAWFPDGSQFVFASNRDGDWELYLGQISNPEQAVLLTENNAVDLHPRISPNGENIVFESNLTGNYEIYTMRADGSNLKQLTFSPDDDRDPVWVEDNQIAFTTNIEDENAWELFLMNKDGSNLRRITYYPADDRGPAWCATE